MRPPIQIQAPHRFHRRWPRKRRDQRRPETITRKIVLTREMIDTYTAKLGPSMSMFHRPTSPGVRERAYAIAGEGIRLAPRGYTLTGAGPTQVINDHQGGCTAEVVYKKITPY